MAVSIKRKACGVSPDRCRDINRSSFDNAYVRFRASGRNLTQAETPERAPIGQAEIRWSSMRPDQAEGG